MRRKQLTPDDECRVLHEAYQFLFRKYNLGEELQVQNQAAFENGEVPPSPGKYGGKKERSQTLAFWGIQQLSGSNFVQFSV